jgi:alpha-1,2-mannosyltransferase
MYLWLAIVVPRPHKEERFLFPIYPMICVTAAISLDLLSGTVSNMLSNYTTPRLPKWVVSTILHGSFVAPMCLISISRSLALSQHYTAPLQLYTHLQYHHHQTRAEASTTVPSTGLVCTAGEWHRFPSSYFLPRGYQLGFLKSSFTGQLPQPFVTNHDEQQEQGPFNDVNREELDRYVSIAECTYLVELITSNHNEEGLQQMEQDASGVWTHIASYPFLDAEQTPLVSRILYIPTFLQNNPLVHAGRFPSLVGPPVYHDYTLYARTPVP